MHFSSSRKHACAYMSVHARIQKTQPKVKPTKSWNTSGYRLFLNKIIIKRGQYLVVIH